jgi:hypothetical protein
MSITRLENLLKKGAGDGLDKIIQRAQKLEELTTALRAELPEEAAPNLVAANLREDGELVLICTSSAWASRLRFESEQLVQTARRLGFMVDRARVTVSQET